jgi:hypothetical protein
MQAEAVQALEQSGILDKLLGPSGGFVLALCAVAYLGRLHILGIKEHAEKIATKDEEIRRLADARVEEERSRSESARMMLEKIERFQDKIDGRWAKLGQTLGRQEMILRAVAKKANVKPGSGTPAAPPVEENGGVSMF